jgi:PAS domain S-box-containing protein
MKQAVDGAVVANSHNVVVYRVCRPDGTELCVEERGHVHLDDSGAAQYLVGTIQDITEKHLAEQALHEALRDAA